MNMQRCVLLTPHKFVPRPSGQPVVEPPEGGDDLQPGSAPVREPESDVVDAPPGNPQPDRQK